MAARADNRITLEQWHAQLQRDPSKDTRPKYPDGTVVRGDDTVTVKGDPTERRLFWAYLASEVPRVWRAVVEGVPDCELGDLTLVRRAPRAMGQ